MPLKGIRKKKERGRYAAMIDFVRNNLGSVANPKTAKVVKIWTW